MPTYRISYDKTADPSELHPDGVPKGAQFDVASLPLVRKWHPEATVVGTVEAGGVIVPYEETKRPGDAPKDGGP